MRKKRRVVGVLDSDIPSTCCLRSEEYLCMILSIKTYLVTSTGYTNSMTCTTHVKTNSVAEACSISRHPAIRMHILLLRSSIKTTTISSIGYSYVIQVPLLFQLYSNVYA